MLDHSSRKSDAIRCSIAILQEVLENLESHDYASAMIRVAVARQMLEEVNFELDSILVARQRLRALLKQ